MQWLSVLFFPFSSSPQIHRWQSKRNQRRSSCKGRFAHIRARSDSLRSLSCGLWCAHCMNDLSPLNLTALPWRILCVPINKNERIFWWLIHSTLSRTRFSRELTRMNYKVNVSFLNRLVQGHPPSTWRVTKRCTSLIKFTIWHDKSFQRKCENQVVYTLIFWMLTRHKHNLGTQTDWSMFSALSEKEKWKLPLFKRMFSASEPKTYGYIKIWLRL